MLFELRLELLVFRVDFLGQSIVHFLDHAGFSRTHGIVFLYDRVLAFELEDESLVLVLLLFHFFEALAQQPKHVFFFAGFDAGVQFLVDFLLVWLDYGDGEMVIGKGTSFIAF